MTTPSSPSSRPQPISLDVDIELTELTPAEGLPTRSPANPASVDMQALLARNPKAAISPDGIFHDEGARTALRTLASFDPTIKVEKIDLALTFTNTFARKAKERFKA